MPRMLLYRRYWDRVQAKHRRRSSGVMAAWDARLPPPPFIDYWPEIPATLPEKMIFAGLVRRRINFYFSYYWGDFPFTQDKEESYRPDFILPDYRIIIEAAGYYWHTRPGMYDYDAAKYALYIAAGWKVYILEDWEILQDIEGALDTIPELVAPQILGDMHLVGDRPFDPKAAITGRMRKYPKKFQVKYRDRIRGSVGILESWKTGKPVGKPPAEKFALFHPTDFSAEYVAQLEQYGIEWKLWLDSIGDYFVEYPEAKIAYPETWEMYNRWKDWWNRFSLSPPS